MNHILKIMVALTMAVLSIAAADAASDSPVYWHDFWLPQYHHERLSYCLADKQTCGKAVADRYCQLLGYEQSQRSTIAHNVGRVSYLDHKNCCVGWRCAGFKLIRCESAVRHQPIRNYYYRYKKFVVPRFHHFRIDWCYQNGKHCGERAAFAFCKQMGYEKTSSYRLQSHLAATQALGNQKLCFGDCKGFSSIVCYR